jgi:hypothetical protein
MPMLRREAESAIIDEWISLPGSERLTEQQAAQFALQMKRKYPFDYVGGDTYLEIRRMMMRHQDRIAHAGIWGRIAHLHCWTRLLSLKPRSLQAGASPLLFTHEFLTSGCEASRMWKTLAVALAAMVAFDLLYMDGQYFRAVMAMLSHWMPSVATFLHVTAISLIAVFPFVAVNRHKPTLATILKIAVIAAAVMAVATQLLP